MSSRLPALAVLLLAALPLQADEAEDRRRAFKEAYAAMEAGQVERARALGASLEDYALVPYLEYRSLVDRIAEAPEEQVLAFLERESDSYVGERVRNAWLAELARRGHWDRFLRHYRASESAQLRCLYLDARTREGVSAELLAEALPEWLSGLTPHQACGKPFEAISASPQVSDAQRWQRIDNALEAGQTDAARRTGRTLPQAERPRVEAMVSAWKNPARALQRGEGATTDERVLAVALSRLAREDAQAAARHWRALRETLEFEPARAAAISADIAVAAVRQDLDSAGALLEEVPAAGVDEAVQRAMVRTAVQAEDWPRLARWTRLPPAEGPESLRWRYWQARALELTGQPEEAGVLYGALAVERDYYGFKAADRVGAAYNIRDAGGPTAAERARVEALQPFVRARELRALGWEEAAEREWSFGARGLDAAGLTAAAAIAHDWGWHDRVIATLGRSGAFDQLTFRFPTPFKDLVMKHADERDLSPATVFSIIRAESAFQPRARSAAGALGLMQLMPATGADTARRIGLPKPSKEALLEARVNIALGTAYLSQMLRRFDGNLAMAAAAYNAGPGRVLRWQPEQRCVPTEFWVETIPFTETHRYVRKVLFYEALYDWRLGRDVGSLSKRLAYVPPKNETASCRLEAVGMNLPAP